MKLILSGLILLGLISSCADSNFLDRAKKEQSILKGVEVDHSSYYAQNIVLITHDLVISQNKPLFFGICTGYIINELTILTAAHCLDKGTQNMKVILNSNPRNQNFNMNDIYEVAESLIHPSYENHIQEKKKFLNSFRSESFQESLKFSDIAVLKLKKPIANQSLKIQKTLKPIKTSDFVDAIVVGFGKTTEIKNPNHLAYSEINGVLKETNLKLNTQHLTSNHLVISQWKKSGVCKGDSGAPVFIKEKNQLKLFAMAVGVYLPQQIKDQIIDDQIYSYDECAGYGVYLNLEKLKPWIEASVLSLMR